ncbi:MAG: hypothetical protein AAF039_13725 [Bacteroidota bacterium]
MKISGKIIPGYGVASGKGQDPRYKGGTIRLQAPFFKERGLDLNPYFMGTLNVDISPLSYELGMPKYFFDNIDWSDHISPENFYFFDVVLFFRGEKYNGLIYMPDPKTKEEHVQKPTVLELILPKIEGLEYGRSVQLVLENKQIKIKGQDPEMDL